MYIMYIRHTLYNLATNKICMRLLPRNNESSLIYWCNIPVCYGNYDTINLNYIVLIQGIDFVPGKLLRKL